MHPPLSASSRPGPECPGPARPRSARRPVARGRLRLAAGLLAAAGLLGCQQAPPAAAPAQSLPLPPAAPPAPTALPTEAATWRFTTGPDSCTGRALGHDTMFSVRLWRGHGVTFVLATRPPPDAPTLSGFGQLRFQGRAGGWSAFARLGPGPVAAASLPLTDSAVGRVALLLNGGTLTPVGAGAAMPSLRLPPAGAAGRAWFACARGMLN